MIHSVLPFRSGMSVNEKPINQSSVCDYKGLLRQKALTELGEGLIRSIYSCMQGGVNFFILCLIYS